MGFHDKRGCHLIGGSTLQNNSPWRVTTMVSAASALGLVELHASTPKVSATRPVFISIMRIMWELLGEVLVLLLH